MEEQIYVVESWYNHRSVPIWNGAAVVSSGFVTEIWFGQTLVKITYMWLKNA